MTADGSLHEVAVSDHRPAMMWAFEPLGRGPDCRFDDANTGSLNVTCEPIEGVEPALTVAVTESPRLPPLLDGWPPLFRVPVTLGFLGVLALIGAIVRR